jgi:rhomboid protease GluP
MGDEPPAELRPQLPTPWVTIVIILLNVAAFAASAAMGTGLTTADPDRLVAMGGSLPALTLSGEPWRLLTSMFLHAGLLHIAMNMFALYSGGRAAEIMFGRRSFLAIYLATGLVGGVATLTNTAMRVTVGASGAIFGVFGAVFAYAVAHRAQLDPEVRAKQMKGMSTFIGLNLVIGFTIPQISLAAHIGGFVSGFVIAYIAERGIDITDRKTATGRRFPRVMLGSVFALAVVGAGLGLLPKSPVAYITHAEATQVAELATRLKKFHAAEKELLDQQNADYHRAVNGEITPQAQARAITEDLIPGWHWLGNDLASVAGLPAYAVPQQRVFVDYVATRIAYLEAVAALLVLDPEDPAFAIAWTTKSAREAEVAAALERIKTVFEK